MGKDKLGFWERLGRFASNPTVIGWLCVLIAALAMSDYSLFVVARHFDTPKIFAVLGGVIFDGASVMFATISFNSVKSGYPGGGAKLATLICALLSAYLNSYHQTLLNQPLIAKLFWAAPPVIAVAVFDAHIRYVKRRTLANQGRIAPDLPVFGKWAWFLFPVKTLRIARTVVKYRLGIILYRNTPGMKHAKPPVPLPETEGISAGSGVSAQTFAKLPRTFPQLPGTFAELTAGNSQTFGDLAELRPGTMKHARAWARSQGYVVSDRGPLANDLMVEYLVAMQPPANPETEAESDETDIPQSPQLREVNGYDPRSN